MASIVGICNRALQALGAAQITALTDGSKNARSLNTAFYEVRDAELRDHPWNFAIQRFQLAASATPPPFGFDNSVPLPTGWVRVLPPDANWYVNNRDWIIEGQSILTNESVPLDVRCVMKVDDPNLMDPLFRMALAWRLATELCEAITQSNTKKQACATGYASTIASARKTNAIEKVPIEAADPTWITQRY